MKVRCIICLVGSFFVVVSVYLYRVILPHDYAITFLGKGMALIKRGRLIKTTVLYLLFRR